jgi:hypothetical protein
MRSGEISYSEVNSMSQTRHSCARIHNITDAEHIIAYDVEVARKGYREGQTLLEKSMSLCRLTPG